MATTMEQDVKMTPQAKSVLTEYLDNTNLPQDERNKLEAKILKEAAGIASHRHQKRNPKRGCCLPFM
jgi:hypothetical protein